MLRLLQFEGENFHLYLTRLQRYVDIRNERGFHDSLRDMVVCVVEGMTAETKARAIYMSGGSLARLGLVGIWDLICYMGHQAL